MSYIGRGLQAGAFRQLDDISSGFDGSDATHTMQVNSVDVTVGDVNQILLSLGGVIQKPGTDFTVASSVITFTTAPAANTSFFAILLGSDNGGTVTPTDVSVTKAKLADEIDIFAGTSLSAADLGVGLHIKTADSGATANAHADELVIENSANSGISILSGTSNIGRVNFGDSGDDDIGIIYYNHSDNSLTIRNDATDHMIFNSIGAVTKPLQPAFNARQSSAQSNLDINGGSAIQIVMATEIFDQNADYNTSNSTFTAPVAGRYQLNFHTYMADVDDDFGYLQLDIVTSNRQYNIIMENSGEDGYDHFSLAVLADMDASDTAIVQIQGNGGADQLDLSQSVFSGFLAC